MAEAGGDAECLRRAEAAIAGIQKQIDTSIAVGDSNIGFAVVIEVGGNHVAAAQSTLAQCGFEPGTIAELKVWPAEQHHDNESVSLTAGGNCEIGESVAVEITDSCETKFVVRT